MMIYRPWDHYWLVGDAQLYSSAGGGMVEPDDAAYVAWCERGNVATTIASMDELEAVLRAANVPPYHLVPKRLIVDRLQAAGFLDAARAALDAADLYTRERWNTRDAIYAADPTARALLVSFGANPDAILAPET